MRRKLNKVLIIIASVFLAVTIVNPNTVSALDDDYSISSPETVVYASEVKADARRQLFNENWKFIYGEQSNAQLNAYDDANWDEVQLPHDYSLGLDYTKTGEAESGYKLGGIGWYRKSFTLDDSAKDKRVIIEFGGVYMNATVYINGQKMGDHPNGFTPFAYDLTDYINYDGENVIAVRVNHKFPSSRWYSGSGIYRNVHLTFTQDVHVDHYGVQILSPNLASQVGGLVGLDINASIRNESDKAVSATVSQAIRDKGTELNIATVTGDAVEIEANASMQSALSLNIDNPKMWSLTSPHLYEVVTSVMVDGVIVDEFVSDYGFRTIDFTADTGFYLNSEAVKLKGVSMHSDQGSLGTAAHERAMERQVEILQDMGVNAIRVTHNPAADELIDIANRKGMLIIDEAFDTWISSKNGNSNDYAVWFRKTVGDNPLVGSLPEMTWAEFDIKTMVRRGMNAPAIISWSVGNEVMEGNSGPYTEYPAINKQLATWVGEVDASRPATIGDNKLKANWSEAVQFGKDLTALNGTVGFNYANGAAFDRYHNENPTWKMYGAETSSAINSRGVYKPSNYNRHLTSYDESAVGWGHRSADSWYSIITRDFMAGEFVWTGFDYLGEPTPYNNTGPGATGAWESPKSSYFGIVDTAGLPKDRFYFYQSQWNDAVNTLHILPAWKEDMVEIDKAGNVRVDVYSDAQSVELFFVNEAGQETSLGRKTFTTYTTPAGHTYQVYEGADKNALAYRNLYFTWNVPFAKGTVYAKSFDSEGNLISDTQGRSQVTTFTNAANLVLEADRSEIVADGRDLSYITIDVVDKSGEIVADAANLVNVSVVGDGVLMALDNGNQVDHEPYDSGQRKAFNGKLVAIVKSTKESGAMTLRVESEGLPAQEITIQTKQDIQNGEKTSVIGYRTSKNYYVKLGHQPKLTPTTTVLLSDGTSETLDIIWTVSDDMFENAGTVNLVGLVEKYNLRVLTNVTIIESVGAVLNYSLVTTTGVESVNLPASRPLVLLNGDVLDTEFPVEWEQQNKENYAQEGTVVINGNARIFGDSYPVKASVRVTDAEVSLGANVAGNTMTLTQNIPTELQSDSLAAIIDGNTGFKTVSSGINNSVWTNYDMAQTGINTSEIVFTFATAQYLGAADLHFYQDAWAARLPESVELYWSNEGTENATWSKIETTLTQGATSTGTPNTTKFSYRFNGVPAVGFKIVITSNPGSNNSGKKLAVGLTEVELKVENSKVVVNTEALLNDILLNDEPVAPSALQAKVINTEYQKAVVNAISHKNVAVTILKPVDKVIRIVTESEDHLKRDLYTINLDQSNPMEDLADDDDLLDYPFANTIATAGAFHVNHASEGDPKYVVDNDPSTIFHTPWGGTAKENFWLSLELDAPTKLDSLRVLSRGGSTNGIVKSYVVACSLDNQTWTEVARGEWSGETDKWSVAKFDAVSECKFVRLTALSTFGEGSQADKFMTAKEMRVRTVVEKTTIEDATLTLDNETYTYDGTEKKPIVTLELDNTILEEGVDYSLHYENNTAVGTARVVARGIVKYEGTVESEFEITPALVNKDQLKVLLDEVLGYSSTFEHYTAASWSVVQEQYNLAKVVYENNYATEVEVSEATAKLELALSGLTLLAQKEALHEILAEAKSVDTRNKTAESVRVLVKAIDQAEIIAADETVAQVDVDDAIVSVRSAIDNLVSNPDTEVPPVQKPEEKPQEKPDGNPVPEVKEEPKKDLPATGVSEENNILYLSLILGGVLVLVLAKYNRKKQN